MSEETPERLRRFREESRQTTRRPWHAAVAGALCLLAGAVGALGVQYLLGAAAGRGVDPGHLRALAVTLEQKQLPDRAFDAYRRYLDTARLGPAARANVCFSVATLAEETGRFEDALAYYYEAEMLGPGGDLDREIDAAVVRCLEHLGRTADLRRELRARTSPRRGADDLEPGEIVLAEVNGEVITDTDLDQAVDMLPPALRRQVTPERKAELLRNLVAERALRDEALRQGLDTSPEVLDYLGTLRDAAMVRGLIDREVRARVTVTPAEIEQAHKSGPDAASPLDKVRDRVEARVRATKEQEHLQKYLDETLAADGVKLYPERLETEPVQPVPAPAAPKGEVL
jgi:tetratricopeptide (TPR) repeat protein